ncbi:hypothetical protein GWI72_18935 [Microvirga tunisiensis]|uniref:Uncharacterized protein n=1 Tax=Pannonibacter tanglangensis TaxID=2750084 RepID=A0A7X5F5Y3_9HYPH|nr:hypothetical protein [Pannonibacter sp. XCT-53]NBN80361.1 hypothetical protein [Pannonibacter sp. XCT-53]
MRASEPNTQTEFELERYIIEHRDTRDEAAPAAAHPGLLAMRYLFENGHLAACGFASDADPSRPLPMDALADVQVAALQTTLAALRKADGAPVAAAVPRAG